MARSYKVPMGDEFVGGGHAPESGRCKETRPPEPTHSNPPPASKEKGPAPGPFALPAVETDSAYSRPIP
jgi:hypothetical protein